MAQLIGLLLGLGLGAFVAALILPRLAPSDPTEWHVDPLVVPTPRARGHYLVRPDGGRAQGPVFDMAPEDALARFDDVARSAPRTRVLAGSVADGRVTYIQRSAFFGFPDYISVAAIPAGDGRSRLAVYSRLRFGYGDMGVNRRRVERWLAAVAPS